ncbi:MAG TPA: hypothetical protein VM096_15905 [Vicinamibacterales bacterium]|nr:hypothetical protein [Vicinamibacterales bacterium]
MLWRLLLIAAAVALSSTVAVTVAQQRRSGAFDQSINHPAIKYLTADTDTVVDRLNQKLHDGSASLVFDEKTGYLKSVLSLLNVPVESQVMVYTQTSLQAQHIKMNNPRAIYFNDTVSVGYIRGAGLIEVMAQDPVMGSIFYVIHQAPAAQATFGRDQQCLRCHLSWDTLGVPGLSILTTFPRKSEMDYANGGAVDHFKPIEERWGGWYVTGRKVPTRHMGNYPLFVPKGITTPPPARASLEGQFDLDGYLTPYSDIVALMVLEHQGHFSNLVTRATWETKLGEPLRIAEAADALADYMLFVDEAKIPAPGIEGSSGFAEKFSARGRLYELDLKTRLQKYPVSYMIYSPAFKSLPDAVKNLVMGKINRVLSGEIKDEKYAHLTPQLRKEIQQILASDK